MSNYRPDKWIIVRFDTDDGDTITKILAGWSGGYLTGDSWKLSSGITKVTKEEDVFIVENYSGSRYYLRSTSIGVTGWTTSILQQLIDERPTKVYDSLSEIETLFAEFIP